MKVLKVVGWILVPYVMVLLLWKRLNRPLRVLSVTWGVIALIIGIAGASGGSASNDKSLSSSTSEQSSSPILASASVPPPQQDKKKDDAAAEAKKQQEKKKQEEEKKQQEKKRQEEEKKKQNQKDVLAFEKSIFDIEASAKPIMDNYQKVMDAVSKGNATIYDAYDAATVAKKAAETLQMNIGSVTIPDGLPKKVNDLLDGARSDISTAYYSKTNAFGAVLKFLDDQKPSNMQKFKDESSMSDSFILSGVSKLFEAKTEVGIDVTKK